MTPAAKMSVVVCHVRRFPTKIRPKERFLLIDDSVSGVFRLCEVQLSATAGSCDHDVMITAVCLTDLQATTCTYVKASKLKSCEQKGRRDATTECGNCVATGRQGDRTPLAHQL
jgi:hypothetical protein